MEEGDDGRCCSWCQEGLEEAESIFSSPVVLTYGSPGHFPHHSVFSIRKCSSRAVTAPARFRPGLPMTRASNRVLPTPSSRALAWDHRLSSEGFRARCGGCVDTEVSMFLSAAIPGPQLGSLPLAHGSTGLGPRWARPSGRRRRLQKVALWSFTAWASARACSQSSDPHGMAAVDAPWGFRR